MRTCPFKGPLVDLINRHLLSQATDQHRRYESLISQCKAISSASDVAHLARSLPVPQGRGLVTKRPFVAPQPPAPELEGVGNQDLQNVSITLTILRCWVMFKVHDFNRRLQLLTIRKLQTFKNAICSRPMFQRLHFTLVLLYKLATIHLSNMLVWKGSSNFTGLANMKTEV